MDNLTIVHSNDLVEASYSLSLDEMRIICLAATKVDSRKENPSDVLIAVSEFKKLYNINNNHVYKDIQNAAKSLMRNPIRLRDGHEVLELAWLTSNRYRVINGSHVVIRFSPEISPYLFELKERFTAINFEYAAKLNTPFSFRLYQWLIKAKNLNKHKSGETVVVELEVEWMKSQAGLSGSYKRWDVFKSKVLETAVSKINANTDISIIEPIPIRTGRKITAVRFVYAFEKSTQAKPTRPRLYRRPKVTKGSHEEGVWMRKNFKLLDDYRKALKDYDPSAKLPLSDLRKLAQYAHLINSEVAKCLELDIYERENNIKRHKPANA